MPQCPSGASLLPSHGSECRDASRPRRGVGRWLLLGSPWGLAPGLLPPRWIELGWWRALRRAGSKRSLELTVAGELALKFESNICAFHEHYLAMGWCRYHRYVIVNGGSLADASQLAYINLDDSKRPVFDTGFVLIRDGSPSLFGKSPFTDWSRWL